MITEVVGDRATRYYNDNNHRHRHNGPAVIWASGDWDWFLHDQWHRYYGFQTNPAFSKKEEWWLHGNMIKEDEV